MPRLAIVTAGPVGDHNEVKYPKRVVSGANEVRVVQGPCWSREPDRSHPALDIALDDPAYVESVYRGVLDLANVDFVAVYVPKNGMEVVLDIVAKITSSAQLLLVMCGCSLNEKLAAIRARDFKSAVLVTDADCAGAMRLEQMMEHFLAMGEPL